MRPIFKFVFISFTFVFTLFLLKDSISTSRVTDNHQEAQPIINEKNFTIEKKSTTSSSNSSQEITEKRLGVILLTSYRAGSTFVGEERSKNAFLSINKQFDLFIHYTDVGYLA